MSNALELRIALGKHDHVKALRDGTVKSDRLKLQFVEFDPLPNAFRQMIRGGDLDISEMAVASHLLAHHHGRPITGLAIPLWGRLPHTNLVCEAASNVRGPLDLQHDSVGVRAYAQTSGVWVRGILQSEYGVDLDGITWVTMEDSHVPEYTDPANAVRNRSDKGLRALMGAGELAAIMGERIVDPSGIRTVISDAEAAAQAWSRRTGYDSIHHILTVRTQLLKDHPWLAQELMDLFEAARRSVGAGAAIADTGVRLPPNGLEQNRKSLQLVLDFSAQQKVTPRVYQVDELFVRT